MDSHRQDWREVFDELVEEVLAQLPPHLQRLLEEVPLHVEDYPAESVLRETGTSDPEELCGLFSGLAITERSNEHAAALPPVVTIYRAGIMAAARDRRGRLNRKRLLRQIRLTILHELAHYHGLSEEELDELGYS